MSKTLNDLVISLDETLYNSLNRASREFEAAVTDCYYYIINGGTVADPMFEKLLDEAVEAHYVYADHKDKVSNDVVIPAIVKATNVNPDTCYIYNTWNIPFDNSRKCTVSNISIVENVTDEVVYKCECPEEYINNVAKLKVRIEMINNVISKLNSVTLNDFSEKSAKALKEKRLDLIQEDSDNTSAFMRDFVSPKIAEIGKNPENLIWSIIANTRTFTLTEKGGKSNITCTSCASSN